MCGFDRFVNFRFSSHIAPTAKKDRPGKTDRHKHFAVPKDCIADYTTAETENRKHRNCHNYGV